MKKYFIRCVNTATEDNPGFDAGTIHEFWYGVDQRLLWKSTDHTAYRAAMVKVYGFSTRAAAAQAFRYYEDVDAMGSIDGYWIRTSSIECLEF